AAPAAPAAEAAHGAPSGADHQVVAVLADAHVDGVAVLDLTGEQLLGELVADGLLDQATQRTCTVLRVVAAHRQPEPGGTGDVQRQSPRRHAVGELVELDVDDLL